MRNLFRHQKQLKLKIERTEQASPCTTCGGTGELEGSEIIFGQIISVPVYSCSGTGYIGGLDNKSAKIVVEVQLVFQAPIYTKR